MSVRPSVLLDQATIASAVRRLGREIAADHPDGVLLIGVLKGALLFVSDLAREMTDVPVEVDFMSISRFAPDSGRVKILQDVTVDIGERDVVLVEDVVDTGLTLAYLVGQLASRAPRRVRTCALLDRTGRRIVPQPVDYRGFELHDEFVLGYGLHVHDLYRNLPFIATGTRDDVADDPACYVRALYGGGEGLAEPGGRVLPSRSEVP